MVIKPKTSLAINYEKCIITISPKAKEKIEIKENVRVIFKWHSAYILFFKKRVFPHPILNDLVYIKVLVHFKLFKL